jgi:hypothetical protein
MNCVLPRAARYLSVLPTDIHSFVNAFCFFVWKKFSPYVGYEFGTDLDLVCSPECGPHREHSRPQLWPYVIVHLKQLVRCFLDRFW